MNGDRENALLMSTKLTTGEPANVVPPKIFAQPFRLAFKKDDTVVWVEVRTLSGLRKVAERLEAGELQEIDRFSTMEMQLWGHMAEHSGFLRYQGNHSSLAAGIQPLGEQTASLANDISSIMGGDDTSAINMLNTWQNALKGSTFDQTPIEQTPVTNEFVKPDGVNYTEKGEDVLREMVLGTKERPYAEAREPSKETIQFEKEAENAIHLFRMTPEPTPEEIEAEAKIIEECGARGEGSSVKRNAIPPNGPVMTGPEAVRIGRLVAEIRQDSEANERTRGLAQAAIDIMDKMIEESRARDHMRKILSHVSFDSLLFEHGTTMEELKNLAGVGLPPVKRTPSAFDKSKLSPHEARKAQDENNRKLMQEVDESDLMAMVEMSASEPMTPEEQEKHLASMEENRRVDRTFYQEGENPHDKAIEEFKETTDKVIKSKRPLNFVEEPDQTYGADHYKPREVTPASDTPMWRALRGQERDPAEEWIEEQTQRGPGSMDTYRDEAQREDPSYGGASEDPKSNDSDQ